jgi:D-aminopeptidase
MISYEFKAGTGTASRRVAIGGQTYTIGTLVQANHGRRPWFTVLGKPVGQMMPEGAFASKEQGSIIVVIATDAPLSGLSLRQIAKRAAIGIGRAGTPGGNSSGDIFLAFSTDPFYLGVVESVDEAVINAIVAGTDTPAVRPEGLVVRGIDTARLAKIFQTGR